MDSAGSSASTSARVREFVAAAGIGADVAVNVTTFGDSADLQNGLADLVVAGTKRATTALLRWYGDDGEPLPRVGDLCVVVDGGGAPRCIYRIVRVDIMPFAEVDAAFAADEGEGDGSLDYWRSAHRAFFEREAARYGFAFTEDLDVVLQRFEVVFVPENR